MPPLSRHIDDNQDIQTTPISTIQGGAALKTATVLNDKRHIITKDTDKCVAVYDVLKVIILI